MKTQVSLFTRFIISTITVLILAILFYLLEGEFNKSTVISLSIGSFGYQIFDYLYIVYKNKKYMRLIKKIELKREI